MLAAVDKRDVLDSQPILDLIWARLLRHLDVENDNTFMTLIDEGFSPAELAKVATVCLYDSHAIAFKLSKSHDDILSIKILTEMIRMQTARNLNNNTPPIGSVYDATKFIEKYVKPEPLLEAIKKKTCVGDFERLIESFFPGSITFNSLSDLGNEFLLQLISLKEYFLYFCSHLRNVLPKNQKFFGNSEIPRQT